MMDLYQLFFCAISCGVFLTYFKNIHRLNIILLLLNNELFILGKQIYLKWVLVDISLICRVLEQHQAKSQTRNCNHNKYNGK